MKVQGEKGYKRKGRMRMRAHLYGSVCKREAKRGEERERELAVGTNTTDALASVPELQIELRACAV